MDLDLDIVKDTAETEVGSYFVANYPPFSIWSGDHVPAVHEALNAPPARQPDGSPVPLGLYLHVPFCRKRCRFCYFRVYTDKNSRDVETYMDALANEIALYSQYELTKGRPFEFVYFGGGTPSFLSSDQLKSLIDRIRAHWTWDEAREVTFECEPGTLKKSKLQTIKEIGVTRLSLGIEHFDDEILSINGRAHQSPENYHAYGWAREVGFDQINIDLIAGMLGETEAKWMATVEEAVKFDPDSITIYQMELPHNTIISRESKAEGKAPPIADWATKRRWVAQAFDRLEQAGYEISSGYTVVKASRNRGFIYRDALWRGADLVGTGVASFGHINGVHVQNLDQWEDYVGTVQRGELPLSRALPVTRKQGLIRELVLQLKLGSIDTDYFQRKFGTDVTTEFAEPIGSVVRDGYGEIVDGTLKLNRAGLLRVDALLPRFFEPQFRHVRYT